MCSDLFLSVFIHANSEYFNSFWTRIFIFPSLRSRRLEVVGARNNERARGRHALARPFFLGPATQAKFLDNGVMMSLEAGRNIISLVFMFLFLYCYLSKPTRRLKVFNWFTFFMDRYSIPSLISQANFRSCFEVRLVIGLMDGSL